MHDSFEFGLSVLKTENRDGRMVVTVYATDTAPDADGDRCSEACLRRMIDRINTGNVELLNSHLEAIGFGRAIAAHTADAGLYHAELAGETALLVEVELDENDPQAKKLFERAQSDKFHHQFSVGGRLNKKNPRAVRYVRGRRVFEDLLLDHIVVTRGDREAAPKPAANERTHIAMAVYKTLGMTESDEAAYKRSSAPYFVRDIAGRLGLDFDDAVTKGIRTAFIEGETDMAGEGEERHEHRFSARLNGENGTLIGMTTSWSAGERHAHMIDLMGEEATLSSGASRGFVHVHGLELPTVRTMAPEEFAKKIGEVIESAPEGSLLELQAKALLQGDEFMKTTDDSNTTANATDTATAPGETPEDNVAETETDAPLEQEPAAKTEDNVEQTAPKFDEHEVGFIKRMARMFSGRGEQDTLPAQIGAFTDHIHKDILGETCNHDELVQAIVALNHKVASLDVDRDTMSVRAHRFLEVVESAGLLKPLEKSALTPDDVAAVTKTAQADTEETEEEVIDSAFTVETDDGSIDDSTQTTAATKAASTETDDMTPEELTKFKEAVAAEVVGVVGPQITDTILGELRKSGVIPDPSVAAKTDDTANATDATDASAGDDDADTGAEDTDTDTDGDGEGDNAAAEHVDIAAAITKSLEPLAEAVAGLTNRLDAVEKTTTGRSRRLHGNDRAKDTGKKGTFDGIFSGAPHQS